MIASNTNRLRNGNEYAYKADDSMFRNHSDLEQEKFATLPTENPALGLDVIGKARHNTDRGNNRGAFSVKEAAEYLGVGKNTLYSLMYSNEIISVKIRGRRLITRIEMDNFLNRIQSEATEMARKGESYVC